MITTPPGFTDVAPLRYGDEAAGVYLGYEALPGDVRGDKIHYYKGLHQVLFGPSNVGKGMRLLAPNLLSVFGKSIIVIDPKGQLAAMTALFRKYMGDDVYIIDPFGLVKQFVKNRPSDFHPLEWDDLAISTGFNPLAMLQPGTPLFFDQATGVADAMIKVGETTEPFWPESAKSLITALLMWECEEAARNGTVPSLQNVRTMLTEADEHGRWRDSDGEVYEFNQGLRATAKEMLERGSYAVKDLIGEFASKQSNETLDSIRVVAKIHTKWLLSEPIRDDLSKTGPDLRQLKTGSRPMTIYAILPSGALVDHSVWLRLFVNSVIRTCLDTVRQRDVLFIMDEFPALGYMEIVAKQWGVVRDYGLAFWIALQNYSQLTTTYPQSYETMISSTGILQSFRVGDFTTGEEISKRGFSGTVYKRGQNTGMNMPNDGKGGGRSTGKNIEQIQMPIIPVHDLFNLPDKRTVAAFAGDKRIARLLVPHLKDMRQTRRRALANPYHTGYQVTALNWADQD